MTALSGYYAQDSRTIPPNAMSSNIGAQTGVPTPNCNREAASQSGEKTGTGVVTASHWTNSGTAHGMFDALLFERMIVVPRTRAMGFVLSTSTFPVEVWNAFQNSAKALTSISINESGVTISGGLGSSATFGPGQSSTYTVTVAQDGPATMASVVTWNFAGGVTGADLSLTGSRLTVFSVEIDWSEGFDESIEYKTAIIRAFSGKEQRIQLRTVPRFGASFAAITTNARETAALDAVVDAWQARVFGVPWWMDASVLTAPASAGANSISVDTTDRPSFEAGGLVMIWRDQFTWQAMTILSVAPSSITFTASITENWIAGDRVVPIKRGRMSETFPMKRETSGITSLKAAFDCEAV